MHGNMAKHNSGRLFSIFCPKLLITGTDLKNIEDWVKKVWTQQWPTASAGLNNFFRRGFIFEGFFKVLDSVYVDTLFESRAFKYF